MRTVLLLAICLCVTAFSADYERFTLADGRVYVGTYDADTSTMTMRTASGIAQFTVRAEDIVKRVPAPPEVARQDTPKPKAKVEQPITKLAAVIVEDPTAPKKSAFPEAAFLKEARESDERDRKAIEEIRFTTDELEAVRLLLPSQDFGKIGIVPVPVIARMIAKNPMTFEAFDALNDWRRPCAFRCRVAIGPRRGGDSGFVLPIDLLDLESDIVLHAEISRTNKNFGALFDKISKGDRPLCAVLVRSRQGSRPEVHEVMEPFLLESFAAPSTAVQRPQP